MTENGNQGRPVRTLTVKNFSVIKEAKLEFGKITVLIGPQASGKSLLCKLAYFLGREVIRLAIDLVVNQLPFSEFELAVQREFIKWFPPGGWGDGNWSISFRSGLYEVTVSVLRSPAEAALVHTSFGQEFMKAYAERLVETLEEQNKRGFLLGPALQSLAATRFMGIAARAVWDASIYIPLERSYFVDTIKGYTSLASESEPIVAQFAFVYTNSLTSSRLNSRTRKYLKGNLVLIGNEWMISYEDGRLLPLPQLSSGSKELHPILAALDYYEFQRTQSGNLPSAELYNEKLYCFDDFTIEEPEASVFPETQYDLVREMAALSNETNFVPYFTITTHSPYILSAFGDLVKAGKVAAEGPENRAEVANVIPENYWIKPDDFVAYKIEDGELQSIFDKRTGQIDGDYLDDVSGKISDEFGQLLEIQYGK